MRIRILALPTTVVLLALAACSSETPAAVPTDEPTSARPTPTEEADVPTVDGLAPGEMPAIPLITLPSMSMVDTAVAGAAPEIDQELGTYPGLTVTPATCDGSGTVQANQGNMLLYGDGSGTYQGPDGSMVNGGDGSGVLSINGVDAVLGGDGSGVFDDGTISIVNDGNGSGTYDDGKVSVVIGGDGSATWEDSASSIVNEGDGSGVYDDGKVSIVNEGDGSGVYDDGEVSIVNDGQGTALVNGTTVPADPLPPVPAAGKFPPLGLLAPVESCGVLITLDAGVLFDFGKYDLRSETKPVLDSLAQALSDLGTQGLEVRGHTDSMGGDDLNQKLSQNRAAAVSAALVDRGVGAGIESSGFGESQPVAPNEIEGKDNPAGRQLNRRVEVFVPAS